ncbi:MAG: two-component regulator propeller domain-containing protein [Dysgonomonas sp.]
MRYIVITIIILTSCIIHLKAGNNSNFYFSNIDGEKGLSQNNVKTIMQDSYGFMWFGTRNRLNRYDGISMKVYNCYDPVSKRGDNNISSLFEDKQQQLWVGTDKGIFIFNPISESFRFFNKKANKNLFIQDWVADIQADLDNNVWIVIPKQGLFRYNIKEDSLHYYAIGNFDLPDQGNPQCICIEMSGKVWVGTNGGGVYLYDRKSDSFTQYLGDKNGSTLRNENIYTMCDYGDELVLGIHEGKLRKINKRKNTLSDVDSPNVHYKIIRHVTLINGALWVGTQSGLYIINELEKTTTVLQEDPMFPYLLSDNIIEKIYKDRENGIWIGTNFGGVDYLPNRTLDFECYVPLSNKNSISSKRVREIREDSSGNIWLATEDAGLNILNPKTKSFQRLDSHLYFNKTLGLLVDNDQAWVGFFKNGLDIIRLPQLTIEHYSGISLGLNESSIYTICQDKNNKIWLGNAWGVFTGDKDKKQFLRQEQFGLNYIYDIIEDSDGYIWVATMGNGVYKYNQTTKQTEHYVNRSGDKTSLSSNSVSNIIETKTGEIWFSTDRGGICRYNKRNDNFTSFSVENGLPDDVSYKILEDKDKNLWFGTNKGLVRFNPESKAVRVFSKKDGLPGNQFNYKSALASSTGKFYFGSLDGLIVFDPLSIKDNKYKPPVYITKLSIFNKEIDINSEDSPLKKSIINTKKITLNYNQSNISFEFVALSYTAPLANKYAYKMENIDKDWTYTNNNHSASYAKLPPGKYIFRVKGSNNDDLWNNEGTSIEIEILHPWWQSNIALSIYLITTILALYFLISWYLKRKEREHTEKRKLFEAEKEKELYGEKVEFFTNIAHEIRTPITLINGPLESLQEMEIEDPEIKKNLKMMNKSTSDLLGLVNQLLDFRKVDSNKFIINLTKTNVSDLVKEIFSKFEILASRAGKKIELFMPTADIVTVTDKDALNKILNNLFSNAIKYSDKKITVELSACTQFFTLELSNDGKIIPEESRPRIFDPFYQVGKRRDMSSSSGIGLSIALSLAELQNGTLIYNERNGLNTFILNLPLLQPSLEKKESDDDHHIKSEILGDGDNYILADDEPELKPAQQNAIVVLVVEDNLEMLAFITDKLKEHYSIEKATNGFDAMKIIEEKSVDMVLTDIMMEGMDGFDLCSNIKTNVEYSHIPVVLLTAKNDLNSKIYGLEMGADAYIEKPFSVNYLITQLNTLLDNRKREKEAFMRKPFLPIQHIGQNKADEQFLKKIITAIEENITDTNFNVERLSEIVGMSRSSLHRKIKSLIDLTPVDFIRLIRLKKAAELIQSGQYNVSEVGYLVGINSSYYFIKLFHKQFGMTPKEFMNKHL